MLNHDRVIINPQASDGDYSKIMVKKTIAHPPSLYAIQEDKLCVAGFHQLLEEKD